MTEKKITQETNKNIINKYKRNEMKQQNGKKKVLITKRQTSEIPERNVERQKLFKY